MTTLAAATTTEQPELSDLAYEILRAALNIARNEQVRTLARLKQKLASRYPSAPQTDIDSALAFWAKRVRDTDSHLR